MGIIKVSVIVPIYNVEKYIERCVRSLMEQTLQEIEYIFVNDCTPDKSMEILQKVIQNYPQRLGNIHILNNQKNRGVSYARNQGINQACGEYLIFCDSDDWIETDMYEELYNHATINNADIVCCDFWKDIPNESKNIVREQKYSTNTYDDIKAMLQAILHGAPWNKLVNRKLYQIKGIYYPENINMWEDLYTSVRLFYFAQNVTYVPLPFYHYVQQNPNSLLNNLSLKKMEERIQICNLLEDFFYTNGVLEYFTPALQQRKLWAKIEFITDNNLKNFKRWRELWPDANSQIFQSGFSIFNKIILILAQKELDSFASTLLKLKHFLKNIHRW